MKKESLEVHESDDWSKWRYGSLCSQLVPCDETCVVLQYGLKKNVLKDEPDCGHEGKGGGYIVISV